MAAALLLLLAAKALAASYTVDISWTAASDGSNVNVWCALNAAPATTGTPTATAPDSAGVVSTNLTANGGETYRCVARRSNTSGNGPLSAEASAVLPIPVPGQIQIFLQIRTGP